LKPKVLIVILVVIAVLFVAGMALGARGGGSPPKLTDMRALVKRFGGKLAASSALKPADVSSSSSSGAVNCANLLAENGQATINPSGFCSFNVSAKKNAVRSMSLQLNQGLSGRFTTENHNPEVKLDINLNQCKQVQIMKEGGTLIVACAPGVQACVFRATQCP
jgi:hypothetical protein